jgi:regulator of sigma E protease
VRPFAQVQRSEFVLSLIPLGGYVTFWDEAQVKEQGILQPLSEAARACLFESQSLLKRSAIVLAGPLANLLLCVLLTWMMYLWGVEQDAPVLASPVAGSVAERWGFAAGSRVLSYGLKGQEPTQAQSLQDFERFVQMAMDSQQDAQVWVQTSTASTGSPPQAPPVPTGTTSITQASAIVLFIAKILGPTAQTY